MRRTLSLLVILGLIPSVALAGASDVNKLIGVGMHAEWAQMIDTLYPALSGNAAFSGNVTVGGTLGVTGATTLSSTLNVTGNIAPAANVVGSASVFKLIQGTADASDNKTTAVGGGGDTSASRGAFARFEGNETASGGWAQIGGGAVSTGNLYLDLGHSSASIVLRNASSSALWTVANSGTLIGAGTGDIGWSVQSAANQACTTTCTTPCVFGQETTSKAILSCSDATADSCLCAGAS